MSFARGRFLAGQAIGYGPSLAPDATSWVGPLALPTASTQEASDGVMRLAPIWLPVRLMFDLIGLEVVTGGSASAVYRLGIYRADGAGRPAALELDAGTVDATSPGNKTIAIATTLEAGLYWLAAANQGAPATRPFARYASVLAIIAIQEFLTTGLGAIVKSGVAGAFPDPLTAYTSSGSAPRTQMRVA